jgi:septum formation protein
MRLILASRSAARLGLLRQAGVPVLAIPSAFDEAGLKAGFTGTPEALALALADAKAATVAALDSQALVIGADQVLTCGADMFDQPGTIETATQHLTRLQGRAHHLITAVTVHQGGERLWSDVAAARMTMHALQPSEIAQYLQAEGAAVLGCVGAYRLEGLGAQLFARVEGDYFTVLGLNLLPLLGFLRAHGVLPAWRHPVSG